MHLMARKMGIWKAPCLEMLVFGGKCVFLYTKKNRLCLNLETCLPRSFIFSSPDALPWPMATDLVLQRILHNYYLCFNTLLPKSSTFLAKGPHFAPHSKRCPHFGKGGSVFKSWQHS